MEFAVDPDSLDKVVNVESHDIVFWMGDLNYRIYEENLSTEKIKQVIIYFELRLDLLPYLLPHFTLFFS